MTGPPGTREPPVAYMMSRFPKLTETFVLNEMLELERQGVPVEIFPLWRERETAVHPGVRELVDRAHFLPTFNLEVLRAMGYWLGRRPLRLLGTFATLVSENLSSPRFLAGALAAFPKACAMARRMKAAGVAHVHAHFASHPAAMALVVGRLADLPFSFTAHGSDLHREQAMLSTKVAEARFVVAISDFNRRFISRHVGEQLAEDKVRVVHCGVDVDSFRPADHGRSDLQIICIGTLHEVKGQRHLLEACARLENAGVAWHCHLVGDGPDRQMLTALARRLGVARKVTFHGRCTQPQVRNLLERMNVGCAPSVPAASGRREGIPVALMEAAASALPLVASRLSGIPELVLHGETGFLVEPGDSQALARALEKLAEDGRLREKLGQGARQHVANVFRLSDSVQQLRRLFFPAAAA